MKSRFNAVLTRTFFGGSIVALALLTGMATAQKTPTRIVAPPVAKVDYNRDIRPILAEKCFRCHGPDAGARKAGLRLDLRTEALTKLASGHQAIIPGKAQESEVIKRIYPKVDALRMPPPGFIKTLTDDEKRLIVKWISQGAEYKDHWAFIPPERPMLPAVQNKKWAQNSIDYFILSRLEKEKLKPSPEADRRTLIRRVSLDLTGLPPDPREVEAFAADKSPNAYEKLVDKLLASPRYGERMAVYWLDLVRYADTVGYHGDQNVNVWPYRDYIIDAFNKNKRFDVFTREQLAGDLVTGVNTTTRVASGYNRLGMMSTEGGVQDKEYRAKYASERVRNASGVWLGITMGCAECHDHKYDPISAKDFYRFESFFADLKEKGFYDGGFPRDDWGPSLRLPSEEQKQKLEKFDADISAVQKELAAITEDTLAEGRAKWEAALKAQEPAWSLLIPEQAVSSGGSTLTLEPNGVVFVSGKLPNDDTYTVTLPAPQERIASIRLEIPGDERLQGNYFSRSGFYFILSEFEVAVQRGNEPPRPIKLVSATAGADDEGYPVMAAIDGRPETGWATPSGARPAAFHFSEPIAGGPDTKLIVRLRHEVKPQMHIGKFRVFVSSLDGADSGAKGVPDNVLAALKKEAAQRTSDENKLLIAHYRNFAPELKELRQRLARLQAERSVVMGSVPKTLVSEATEPRPIRILPRGNWMDDSGEIVQPGVPGILRQIGKDGRASRLDLAEWITSPENPLTARVFVNRLWKLTFGVGLAKNLDDLGAQGEPPVHPELLDWLATEFVRSKWDIKRMVRLIVTSAAYRQSSKMTPELLAKDPYNRLYARQSVLRLDAEFVRDNALAVSGLLTGEIGGPSVHPYQPRGYLAALNFPRREWAPDTGDALYRRALYTHWQRTFLHPSLLAFDAPSREECTVTRIVSNTPLQALVLMNDPIYVEAARVFAENIEKQGGDTFEKRLDFAYRRALSRAPRPEEVVILRRLYHTERARYAVGKKDAERVLTVGEQPAPKEGDAVELAAWTAIARALLNLHETISRS